MNTRLGIIGGMSILGTTGIVVPYSCSSWIYSIRRRIDVACAAGLDISPRRPVATSEQAMHRRLADSERQAGAGYRSDPLARGNADTRAWHRPRDVGDDECADGSR